MSREIEFRGLDKHGVMHYGSLVTTNMFIKQMPACHTKHWIVTSSFGNGGWFNIRGRSYVKPETVGQFTGLLDCNGVKIFEGILLRMVSTILALYHGMMMTQCLMLVMLAILLICARR